MIIDLQRFVATERPYWDELKKQLDHLESNSEVRPDLSAVQRFHYLYERTAADLAKLNTFASEPELRSHLESLLARAYGEIHETRDKAHRFAPLRWFRETFPQTFRKHGQAFLLSVLITIVGCVFGGGAVAFDPESKSVLMPFSHLQGSPKDRVAEEESAINDRLKGHKSQFSTGLMTHNIKVSITALALGMTWGIGSIILLFYNGVILGAVAIDYILAGETRFLFGWLLPHGSVEIPAILIAGQAGLVLGRALIGWGGRTTLRNRMRLVTADICTLTGGLAVMLVWAGLIESFFSQYHEPVLPYAVKIAFGSTQLVLLALFLGLSGRKAASKPSEVTHA
ncbi:MAG TPA: stage II sporulation protein M [Roseimicrobium sp.]|nr:stage II sporulation protein M [Roseimicrobium sp.]